MWVRCQARTVLMNANGFYTDREGTIRGSINDAYNVQDWNLGKYESQERANEILDEIEGHIKAGLIYQMPEK